MQTKTILLAAALIFSLDSIATNVTLSFQDECLGDVITATPPGSRFYKYRLSSTNAIKQNARTHLRLDITDAPKGSHIRAFITLSPQGRPNDKAYQSWKVNTSVSGSENVFYQGVIFPIKRPHHKQLNEETFVWIARAQWQITQPNGQTLSGISNAPILVVDESSRNLYQTRSQSLCRWQGPLSIASELKTNMTGHATYLSLNIEQSLVAKANAGILYGLIPPVVRDNNTRHDATPNFFRGQLGAWFFLSTRWNSEVREHLSVSHTYNLPPGAAAYFMARYSFDRYQGVEYKQKLVRKRYAQCLIWEKSREGYLDVGTATTSLYQIPWDLVGQPEAAAEFVNNLYPGLNNCEVPIEFLGEPKLQVNASESGVLFFTPKKD